ncbi:hypothetical protein BGX34_003783 [Mortierella sp. NVP85]|nr:hypothetical protein BGX34_003783 [Mortierella sp. NVP85]
MFLAELIVGYTTGSLALIADAFHMLSDVLSQIIALYAIRLAAKTKWKPSLSYGWQRAELLGALYNGVFLLALCFTIVLDALERFFEPEDIKEPKLVLIVGGIGLVCNLLGLVLFHDHSGIGHGHGHSHGHSKASKSKQKATEHTSGTESDIPSPTASDTNVQEDSDPEKGRSTINYESSLDRISPLKEANLQNLQQAALEVQRQIEKNELREREEAAELERHRSTDGVVVDVDNDDHDDHDHSHSHDHGKESKGPSGEDLNMRGIFLHVLGDALGSVGVIFTALFIWLTDFSWRFYMDPIISLFITAIIIRTALPLVRAASFVLMQGVPVGIDIEEVRKEIKAIPGVISIHDLHIWQLTNIKMVSSLHVLVTDQEVFERVSRAVKTIMHRAGVHSTTIQPEFLGTHKGGYKSIPRDEEGKIPLSSRATSLGAQSEESLPRGLKSSVGHDASADGALTTGEQTIVGDSNCTQLCMDGEQACDVGSCCTAPVKR